MSPKDPAPVALLKDKMNQSIATDGNNSFALLFLRQKISKIATGVLGGCTRNHSI